MTDQQKLDMFDKLEAEKDTARTLGKAALDAGDAEGWASMLRIFNDLTQRQLAL